MRHLYTIFTLILLTIPFVSHTQGVIDTTLCFNNTDSGYFYAPYDTELYNFEWSSIDNNFLSDEDSLDVLEVDTLILVSTLIDNNEETLIDTFALNLRFAAIVMFDIPAVECYSDSSLIFKDNSILDTAYTTITYGQSLLVIDSLISVNVGNGDTVDVTVNYTIEGCSEETDTDTTITLSTLFTPELSFISDEVCLGNTTITNSSLYNDTAMFSLIVDDALISFDESSDTFSVSLDNGVMDSVFVQVMEGSCTAYDTLIIRNKLQPTAGFEPDKTCGNEITVESFSQDITTDVKYKLQINGQEYNSLSIISNQFPHGDYDLNAIVDNNNGCRDTLLIEGVEIDSVTYVTFTGLDKEYCERQGISQLLAQEINGVNLNGGTFSGSSYLDDLGNGQAIFEPTAPEMNIDITYSYTNDNMCTDTETIRVDTIRAKPDLKLLGLLNQYCIQDSVVSLAINQELSSVTTSIFNIDKDGVDFFDTIGELSYNLNLAVPGDYHFLNYYEDAYGCFGYDTNTTTINLLPNVEIDSLAVITPGQLILIENLALEEPNTEYTWSNGSVGTLLSVDLPGIYLLSAMNQETLCEGRDTVKIEFDSNIENELIGIQISPNPTIDQVIISLSLPAQDIRLVDIFGTAISLNGFSSYSTDSSGELILDMSNQDSGYYYILIPKIGNFLILKI